jgi:hypothetical protein
LNALVLKAVALWENASLFTQEMIEPWVTLIVPGEKDESIMNIVQEVRQSTNPGACFWQGMRGAQKNGLFTSE